MDNIKLTPYESTSPPFDFDSVYEEGRQRIYSSVNVTGKIQMIDIGATKEPLLDIVPDDKYTYELPNQQHQYVPRSFYVPAETELDDNIDSEPSSQEIVAQDSPSLEDINPTEEDLKNARKLLSRRVKIIESRIRALPKTKENRRLLLGCIQVEKKNKNRKSVFNILETAFLSIPPEGE